MAAVKGLFGLLGFEFAKDKLAPFDITAEMLGVEVDLSHCKNGVIKVDNKQKRKDELVEVITELMDRESAVLPSILGRMQFADMQVAGKMGKLAMADIRELGTVQKLPVELNESALQALKNLKHRMAHGRPRSLSVSNGQKPVLLSLMGRMNIRKVRCHLDKQLLVEFYAFQMGRLTLLVVMYMMRCLASG